MADGFDLLPYGSQEAKKEKEDDKQEGPQSLHATSGPHRKNVVKDNVRQEDLENIGGGLCLERGDVAPNLS